MSQFLLYLLTCSIVPLSSSDNFMFSSLRASSLFSSSHRRCSSSCRVATLTGFFISTCFSKLFSHEPTAIIIGQLTVQLFNYTSGNPDLQLAEALQVRWNAGKVLESKSLVTAPVAAVFKSRKLMETLRDSGKRHLLLRVNRLHSRLCHALRVSVLRVYKELVRRLRGRRDHRFHRVLCDKVLSVSHRRRDVVSHRWHGRVVRWALGCLA
jgi:hypothetical protein